MNSLNNKMLNQHHKTELALLVGNDLSEAEALAVKRQMALCPESREHHKNLEQGMKPLREFAEQTAEVPQADLWPGVKEQLKSRSQIERRRHLLHTFAPAASVLVACSFLFLLMGQTENTAPNNHPTGPTVPVSAPMGGAPVHNVGHSLHPGPTLPQYGPAQKHKEQDQSLKDLIQSHLNITNQ